MFVCALLLSVAFSSIVRADETQLENLKIDISHSSRQDNAEYTNEYFLGSDIVIYPDNGTVEKVSTEFSFPQGYSYTLSEVWRISNKDGNLLFTGGRNVKFRLENGYYNIGYTLENNNTGAVISSTYIQPKYNKVLVGYYDGTYEYFDWSSNNKVGRPTTLYLDFTPEKDVISIEFRFAGVVDCTDTTKYWKFWAHTGEQTSDDSFRIIVDTESVEAGLLSGIIGWIKNIYDTIVNLPSKIWEFISEGLKGLFVPSEEYLTKFKSDMDSMLSEKLGAIYQVVNILFEGWDRIQANDSSNTIDFPEVTIPLPNDTEFTFGGQSVQIVPEGFDFLATAIKTVTGICCTVLFVNGLKKRYDDIMGG